MLPKMGLEELPRIWVRGVRGWEVSGRLGSDLPKGPVLTLWSAGGLLRATGNCGGAAVPMQS